MLESRVCRAIRTMYTEICRCFCNHCRKPSFFLIKHPEIIRGYIIKPKRCPVSLSSSFTGFLCNDLIQMKEAAAHFDTQLKTTSKTPEEESSCRSRLKRRRRNTSTPNSALISGGPTPNVTLIALPKNVSPCLIIGRQ